MPGPHNLTPLMIYDGNDFIDNDLFESDDETVVLQILPGNSQLGPRPRPIVTQQPLPPVTPLMDPFQLYNWYWSNGRRYAQVIMCTSQFQTPPRPL